MGSNKKRKDKLPKKQTQISSDVDCNWIFVKELHRAQMLTQHPPVLDQLVANDLAESPAAGVVGPGSSHKALNDTAEFDVRCPHAGRALRLARIIKKLKSDTKSVSRCKVRVYHQ